MAAIDRLLEAALRHRVETIILEPGRRPRLRREGFEHEVTAQPLDAVTVERLVAEIAPNRRLPDPREEPRWGFDYTLGEASFHFVGMARANGWLFTAAILPLTQSETPPPVHPERTIERGRRPLPAMEALLRTVAELGASDLHLTAWQPPWLRIHGELAALETFEPPTSATLKERLFEVTPQRLRDQFEESGQAGFVHPIEGLGRFRVRLFREIRGIGASIRFLPERPRTAAELELPAALLHWTAASHGLILLAGPKSSGRTTTLGALVLHLAQQQARHVLTIERQVEYELASDRSLVRQLEVATGNSSSLAAAVRQLDVDVVAFADPEESAIAPLAVELASSGRLVLFMIEAASATVALSRLIDSLRGPGNSHAGDRLADVFGGLAVQKLARRAQGPGRLAVWELVPPLPSVTACLRERQLWKLPAALAAAHEAGAIHETEGLADLVSFQFLTPEEALRVAWDRDGLRERLEAGGMLSGGSAPTL